MTVRTAASLFGQKLDAAATWIRNTAYDANTPFSWRPTQASAVDIDGNAIPQNDLGQFAYRVAKTSLDEAEPTVAEFALMEYLGSVTESAGAPLPTSMGITSVSGNQTGNGFTANGVYRSNNTGPLNGTGLGNWTWRVKATRIGDWIQHHYWNDTANTAFRESFDGGTTWTAWAA